MRQFGKIKLSQHDYKTVVKRYIRFYKKETVCSDECPIFFGSDQKIVAAYKIAGRIWGKEEVKTGKGECFCCLLPMFPDFNCPCSEMGWKAFVALEKFVKTYGEEFM